MDEIKIFWANYPSILEKIKKRYALRDWENWEVCDEIKIKFHWKSLSYKFRMKLIRKK